jgi:hypothetical protein
LDVDQVDTGKWSIRLTAAALAGDRNAPISTTAVLQLAAKSALLLACGALPWALILWACGVF